MEIETKNASLDTVSVTIQALHVNGKQMTLAVFRQIPRRKETAASTPWGVVSYHIKEEGTKWCVFSENGLLFRRCVDYWPDWKPQEKSEEMYEISADFYKEKRKLEWMRDPDGIAEVQANLKVLQDQYAAATARRAIVIAQEVAAYEITVKLSGLPQLFIAV